MVNSYLIFLFLFILIINFTIYFNQTHGQTQLKDRYLNKGTDHPQVADSNLKVEEVADGLRVPTTMAFLGPDDFLILEKDTGTVMRVNGGIVSDIPILDVEVANSMERGMCGIAVSKNGVNTIVYLYYTEIDGNDGGDRTGKAPIGNRLYKYELVGNKLVNPVLLLDLPADPGPRHNGGAIQIGPDNNIYVPVGDVDGSFKPDFEATQTQNFEDGIVADGRSGILRLTQGGKPVGEGILGDSMPLRLYYAYGIRNSFGLDFDPITGFLWDTENGPADGDEINLINPGFNSGWNQMYGFSASQKKFNVDDLVTFDGNGKYNDPKLVWTKGAGLTSIVFLDSDKLGPQYENDMFVGDVHNGRIYHFELNQARNDLVLPTALADRYIRYPPDFGAEEVIFNRKSVV